MNELLCTVCGRKYSEGTSAWALKMLRLGKKLVHANWPGAIFSLPKGGMIQIDGIDAIGMSFWYDYFAIKYCDAWSIYPEPRPETAKEPEIVAHKQHANCLVCGKVIEGLLDGHATVSIKRYSISSLYESTYSHYCGKCFLELGFDKTERELRNRQQPIAEPEPEPKFAVGDWVEYSDGTLQQAIIEAYSGQPGEQMVYVWHPQTAHSAKTPLQSITRKLDPSEIVLDFGNGIKGTIRRYRGEQIRIYDGDINLACLAISYVTEPMQTTVRKLLAAIEEERKKQ
jgi:hypothetical protein